MSKYKEAYQEKLITANEAVKLVKSGDWVQYGEFVVQPKALDAALAKRKNELQDVKIKATTITWIPEVCKVDPKREAFTFHDWHFSGISRQLQAENLCNYIPITYHEVPQHHNLGLAPVDITFNAVTPMDENGYFNFSTSCSLTPYAIKNAKLNVVEVNSSLPVCLGGNMEGVHISDIDYIVENQDNPPLLNLPEVPASDVDTKIAELIIEDMHNGDCIQLGIGAMPNVLGSLIARSDLKDLGVHTEMLVDSFVEMYDAGKITNKKKQINIGKMVYTFAMGTDKLYNFLHKNPVAALYPVNYTNDPYVIGQNDNVVAINNCIEVDLFGQVASEASAGRQISGTGGQFDFIFGAYKSKGGRPIIALSSTVKDKQGNLHSRIVPGLSPGTIVTVPRSITSWVVTEYGKVNLKSKSTWERAEMLISIAHPDFRDELVKAAENYKIWRKSNKQDNM